jgi:hypothetical protein
LHVCDLRAISILHCLRNKGVDGSKAIAKHKRGNTSPNPPGGAASKARKRRKTNDKSNAQDDQETTEPVESDDDDIDSDDPTPRLSVLTQERSELVDAMVQCRGAPVIPRALYETYTTSRRALLAREKADAAAARLARHNASASAASGCAGAPIGR